ncbi:hypothetical protein L208DRAFT_385626 [Tricholoma matsutake]|nr:hypothetical protein L208DRAFT_385626 [Tricholoma matsutake 945]
MPIEPGNYIIRNKGTCQTIGLVSNLEGPVVSLPSGNSQWIVQNGPKGQYLKIDQGSTKAKAKDDNLKLFALVPGMLGEEWDITNFGGGMPDYRIMSIEQAGSWLLPDEKPRTQVSCHVFIIFK